MSACLLVGAMSLALSGPVFQLQWTHSVERIGWRETWRITADGLRLSQAAIKGSGAGMEPGDAARLENGWWVWAPDLPPQPQLLLAASGATGDAWSLCDDTTCHSIGAQAGEPIRVRACPED